MKVGTVLLFQDSNTLTTNIALATFVNFLVHNLIDCSAFSWARIKSVSAPI